MKRLSIASLLFVCCCTSASTPSPTTTVDVRAAPSAPEVIPAAPEERAVPKSAWVGSWESTECADRKYPRRLELLDDGTFVMTDLVAPCPPGAKCVWSGVVARKGTWTQSGGKIVLTYDPAGSATANGKGQSAPSELKWDADKSAPVEGHDCVYTRR